MAEEKKPEKRPDKKAALESKLDEYKKEYSKTKHNKATNLHLGILRAKIADVKKEIIEAGKKHKGEGFFVKKRGDATVALLGFPERGKVVTDKPAGQHQIEDGGLRLHHNDDNSRNHDVQGLPHPDIRYAGDNRGRPQGGRRREGGAQRAEDI